MSKNLKKITIAVVASLFALQLALIFTTSGFFPSDDQQTYLNYALESDSKGEWFPSEHNLINGTFFAPGYINFLLLYHRIFGTFSGFGFVNFIMAAAILAAICSIAKRFFGSCAACGTAIIYSATYSNWFSPIGYFSEIPFVFFVTLALAFALLPRTKWANYLLAGVLIAVGNWIRPLALAYFLGIILFAISKKEYAKARITALIVSTLITITAIGFWTKANCGTCRQRKQIRQRSRRL